MSFKSFKERLERIKAEEAQVEEPVVEETEAEEPIAEETKVVSLDEMTKTELDEYALNYDIELDRRKTKPNMIKDFLANLKGEN